MLKKYLIQIILILFIIVSNNITNAQIIKRNNFFVSAGIMINGGTSLNRAGLFFAGYYVVKHFQFNMNIRPIYNINGLGTLKSFPELIANLGVTFGYGKTDSLFNNFTTPVSNHTGRKYSCTFSYNLYIDNIGTTQGTGTVAFEFGHFGIIHENDMWGEPRSDKFRSAAMQFYYRTEYWKYTINVILWHGDAFDQRVFTYTDTDYPARFGYKDLSNVKYGKTSAGILSANVSYAMPNMQIVSFGTGINSEYVRHIAQNKMIHDKWFLPDKIAGYELKHYPMLDTEGNPYLFKKEQKIKPTELYFNFGFNQNLFY